MGSTRDARRAGPVTRKASHQGQQRGGRREGTRIAGRYAEELRAKQASSGNGSRNTQDDADGDQPQR